ncbi:hypothetical protein HMI55_007245 [Coelomomyces lativittatus]|nr:hypothetical protein HMI55_007245 [Coelomomyces lativittatus]
MAYKNVWKDSIRLLKTLKVLSLNLYNKMQKVVISFKQGEPHLVRNNKTWQVSLNFLKNVTDILEKEIQNIRREKTFDGKKFFLVLQNFHIHGTEMYVFVIKNMIQKNLQYYKDSIKCFKEVVINLENKLKKRKQIKQLDEDAQVQMDIGFEWRKFLHVHYAASLELLFNQQKMNITKRSIFQHQCSII